MQDVNKFHKNRLSRRKPNDENRVFSHVCLSLSVSSPFSSSFSPSFSLFPAAALFGAGRGEAGGEGPPYQRCTEPKTQLSPCLPPKHHETFTPVVKKITILQTFPITSNVNVNMLKDRLTLYKSRIMSKKTYNEMQKWERFQSKQEHTRVRFKDESY